MTNKNTKKQKLAGEFAQVLKDHKAQIIMYAIVKDENVLNTKLLKRYKDMEVISIEGQEDEFDYYLTRAYRIHEDVENRTKNGEIKLYDSVYKLCWNKIKNRITDNYSFNF